MTFPGGNSHITPTSRLPGKRVASPQLETWPQIATPTSYREETISNVVLRMMGERVAELKNRVRVLLCLQTLSGLPAMCVVFWLGVCSLIKVFSFHFYLCGGIFWGWGEILLNYKSPTPHTHTHIQTPGISDQVYLLHPAERDKINSVPPEKKKRKKQLDLNNLEI